MTYLRSPCSNIRPLRNGPPRPRRPPPNQPMKSGSKSQPPRPPLGLQPIQMPFHIPVSLVVRYIGRYIVTYDISQYRLIRPFLPNLFHRSSGFRLRNAMRAVRHYREWPNGRAGAYGLARLTGTTLALYPRTSAGTG